MLKCDSLENSGSPASDVVDAIQSSSKDWLFCHSYTKLTLAPILSKHC